MEKKIIEQKIRRKCMTNYCEKKKLCKKYIRWFYCDKFEIQSSVRKKGIVKIWQRKIWGKNSEKITTCKTNIVR